ncbi:carboxypeptidase-like regulatory domain-containing protein, partial [Allorhizocola rhizosphaerae]|uniref:carboxypeptidase-like regulatory domain-containing protein n=1 Tax=Allorhizocola rhizosphaerae TaxID=1872709 RepID=UPI0013C2BAEE
MFTTSRGAGVIATVAILVSLGIAAPARAETAAISGRITDHTGAPAAGVSIFSSNEDGTSVGGASTNASGAYRIANLKPGRFYLDLRTNWGGTRQTERFDVSGETVFDYALPAIGSVTGRLSKQDGTGAADVTVGVTGNWRTTRTDANGDWRVEQVFAGADAIVTYFDPRQGIQQYAYGKLTHATADRVTVVGGQTTTVNEVVLPTGSVRVTAKDSVTGAPVLNFIASARFARHETSAGEAILDNVTAGTHVLYVDSPGYIAQDPKEVTVVAGQRVDIEVTLTPEAKIDVTVVDAITGAPLRGVCVAAVSPRHVPEDGCWNTTGDDGRLTIAGLPAGGHQLLAVPTEAPGHGAQWVGVSGGTGRQVLAATVE